MTGITVPSGNCCNYKNIVKSWLLAPFWIRSRTRSRITNSGSRPDRLRNAVLSFARPTWLIAMRWPPIIPDAQRNCPRKIDDIKLQFTLMENGKTLWLFHNPCLSLAIGITSRCRCGFVDTDASDTKETPKWTGAEVDRLHEIDISLSTMRKRSTVMMLGLSSWRTKTIWPVSRISKGFSSSKQEWRFLMLVPEPNSSTDCSTRWPLSETGSTGCRQAVEWMEATNKMPATRTKRYMVVASKPK